ncbi:MAG: M20/M25/M40 family metallo-hydrolase [Chitinophagaceae bacterium]|nr:M20/M25/M40 family metallo-hydrolase [Chitinophagaceae bacterium]
MRKSFLLSAFTVFSLAVLAQSDKPDMDVVQKIRTEGLNNSRVMEHAFYLTDVSGPRLNNSTGYLKAANWAKDKLKEWGLDAKLEAWGDWGKGWDLQRSYIAMTAPYYRPLIAFPKAWCNGTNGLQNAEIIIITAKDSLELDSYKGKLKGKVILLPRTDTLKHSFLPDATRFNEEQLKKMADWEPAARPANQQRGPGNGTRPAGPAMSANRVKDFAQKEGAVAILSATPRGHDGTLFVSGGGSYAATAPGNFLDITVAYEDYMTLYRLAAAKIPVKMEVDVKTSFNTKDIKGYNVVAEIKGTDSKLKDEVVIIGGHLDSWHAATGATDNAAGCSVMMEAIRILKATGFKPRRTIRICLWGGEEQGLHGSRNYVRNHLTDTAKNTSNAAGEKVSAYYNLDNGTGKIRGIYTQGNPGVKSIFAQWLEPFSDLGAATITLQNTGGTDHQSFDRVSIPGFQFIQDVIEYDTRTHHTNMDTYDHLIPEDLKQAATIVASFVYNTAQREEKLPRKPAPAQTGQQRQGF